MTINVPDLMFGGAMIGGMFYVVVIIIRRMKP